MRAVCALLVLAAAGACGKGKAPPAAASSAGAPAEVGSSDTRRDDGAEPVLDAREAALWTAAGDGDPEDLMRLADEVGCAGLRERAATPGLRAVALRAMGFCGGFSELPWLAQVSTEGADADARAALDAVLQLAARPRTAVDPEDAQEIHDGCAALLGLAAARDRPRDRRALAVSALRMLGEYGCVTRAQIPTDLDAR